MRPTLKSTIGAMLDSFGTHRATTPPSGDIAMAAHLAALFKSLKIDLVIDVGADQGQFGTLLRDHVGYTGPIASFEPIPASFATLQHRASIDPMWQVEHAALGEALGDLPLNVIDLQNFRPAPPPNTQRLPARHTAQIKRQTIPVRTLDDIVPALRTRTRARHIFLKLDTNARDRAILHGGEHALGTIAAIQTELYTDRQFEDLPHYLGLLSYFQAKHFTPNQFFPTAAETNTQPTHFTCCMVNTSHR
ncbi:MULTISPECIES: FkbM family methyltransferase [Acidiphilium]|uniref:Methyltransferase, FkbM family n=1 Tax=Acidiphilium rubrum TaxID=526 RepID=A0A8G2CI68_ACIRU|nr:MULTISPECIES: FkbM family methyltransferase [Acidiphilium]SIQ20165.1 methyltransferase, FkbM family [Acidiphilium rubrum]